MKRMVKGLFIVLLAAVMAFSAVIVPVSAKESTKEETAKEEKTAQKAKKVQKEDFDQKLVFKNGKRTYTAYLKSTKEKSLFEKQKPAQIISTTAKNVGDITASLWTTIHNQNQGEEVDWGAFATTAIKGVANAVASIWGLGGASDALFSTIETVANLYNHHGATPMSEVDVLTDEMHNQFNQTFSKLDDVQDDIAELSNTVTEEANRIIEQLSSQMNALDAGQYVRTFMISGEGNFSYNQFKTFVAGPEDDVGSLYRNQAYYQTFFNAYASGASDEVLKVYYDQLYNALMAMSVNGNSNYVMFYEYLNGTQNKSINRYYYDFLAANPDQVTPGKTAQEQALEFANSLYCTAIQANSMIQTCNLYQALCLQEQYGDSLSDNSMYCFNQSSGEFVTYREIKDHLNGYLESNREMLENSLLADIAYITGMGGSYFVEEPTGEIYEVADFEPETFGQVVTGQTVILNTVSDKLVAGFSDFDYSDCKFVKKTARGSEILSSAIVPVENEDFTVEYFYRDTLLYSIVFHVNSTDVFNGGDGSYEYPYNISNIEQFERINDDLYACYRLIQNLDFGGAVIPTVGDYETPFYGTFDGNGRMISNAKVVSAAPDDGTKPLYVGIFSRIGEGGCVKNTNFESIKLISVAQQNENDADENQYYDSWQGYDSSDCFYYQGIVAGENEGSIENCYLKNVTLDVKRHNEVKNRNLYVYVGGIVGANCGTIRYSGVENAYIGSSSYTSYEAESDAKNANNLYIGGIAGETYGVIDFCGVRDIAFDAKAESRTNSDDDTKPFVNNFIGGIAGMAGEATQVTHVFSTFPTDGDAPVLIYKNDSRYRVNTVMGIGGRTVTAKGSNAKAKRSAYIPDITVESTLSSFEDIFPTETEHTVAVLCNDAVPNGSDRLDESLLTVMLDGEVLNNEEKTSYDVTVLSRFDSQNEDSMNSIAKGLTLLIKVYLENETVIERCDCEYAVAPNEQTGISVSDLEISGEDLTAGTLTVEYQYSTPIEDVRQIGSGGYTLSFTSGTQQKLHYGLNEIVITVGDFSCKYSLTIECPEHQWVESHQEATCAHIGYSKRQCKVCGAEEYTEIKARLTVHSFLNAVEKIPATCTKEGETGRIYCIDCGTVIVESVVIPKIPHQYTIIRETEHVCAVCHAVEAHQYTVSESVNSDGYRVYTYTCYSCQYRYSVTDTNTAVADDVPQLVVSDGFGLKGGDIVRVYVQLLNNPGISGACFGVRYDSRLRWVGYSDGEVLSGSIVGESHAVNCGYNFLWANASSGNVSGNLLAIDFMIPYDARLGDYYSVEAVYGVVGANDGGFVLPDNSRKMYVTRSGIISMVDHLPGDADGDGVVDLRDAVYIARCAIGGITEADYTKEYVDVNLDRDVNVVDVVYALQALNGGYGKSFINPDFRIILEGNGMDLGDHSLSASIYREDSNVYNLPSPTRYGYQFAGWYTRIVGGNKIENGSDVNYDMMQLKQTLYAHWILNKVSFDMSNATSEQLRDVAFSDSVKTVELINPEKQYTVKLLLELSTDSTPEMSDSGKTCVLDYGFLYWEDENGQRYAVGNTIDLMTPDLGEVTLTAVWDSIRIAEEKKLYTERTGYEFGGYYSREGGVEKLIDAGGNIDTAGMDEWIAANRNNPERSLVGSFTRIKGTIHFEIDEDTQFDSERSMDVYYGDSYSFSVPTKTGYAFKGWFLEDGTQIISKTGIPLSTAYFTNVGTAGKSKCRESITLYAKFEPIQYSVEFEENCPDNATGDVTDVMQGNLKVLFDETFSVDPPSLNGWTFTGWTISEMDNCKHTIGSMTTVAGSRNGIKETNFMNLRSTGGAVIFTAQWKPNTYTVKLDPNGGTVLPSEMEVTFNNLYGSLPIPEKDGYKFIAWTLDGQNVFGWTKVQTAGNHTLVARFGAKDDITAIFDPNGGTCDEQSRIVKFDSPYQVRIEGEGTERKEVTASLPIPTRTGYMFAGWFTEADGGTEVTDATTVKTTENHTLYAHWTINQYTITFKSYDGTVLKTSKQNYGTTISAPSIPEKVGYTTHGWNQTIPSTMPAYNLTIAAKAVTANHYTVLYNANGGAGTTASSSHVYDVAKTLTANGFSKTGWSFNGWNTKADGSGTAYANGASVKNLTATANGNVTLYAQWKINQYTITFKSYDGTIIKTVKQNYETAVSAPSIPGKIGHTTQGWDQTVPATMPAYNLTIKAKDPVANHYTVLYNANGGTGTTASSSHVYDVAKTLTANGFSKTGWSFNGWNTKADGSGTAYADKASVKNLTAEPNGTVTLYAQWKANTYTITLNANSGTIKTVPTLSKSTASVVFNSNSNVIGASVVSASYYVVNGWYTASTGGTKVANADGSFCKSVSGYTNASGEWIKADNATLYAHWNNVSTYSGYTYISTADDLRTLLGANGNYLLLNDINLNGATWTPIDSFSGTLDGNGKSIFNFSISKSGTGTANIGFINQNYGKIKDLTIGKTNVQTYDGQYSVKYTINYTEGSNQSHLDIGGFVGHNSGTITGCRLLNIFIDATFNDNNNDQHLYLSVGGIAGQSSSTITGCQVEGCTIDADTTAKKNSGDNSYGYLGGICAYNEGSTISQCSVKLTTLDLFLGGDGKFGNRADSWGTIGGIVGEQQSGTITSSCSLSGNTAKKGGATGGYTGYTIVADANGKCGSLKGGSVQ